MSITREDIRSEALRLGFVKTGFAAAGEAPEAGSRLAEWLRRGYDASMSWIGRASAKRSDPRLILPGARTVISVGMNYYTPFNHRDGEGLGKISRYAWGDDYHVILSGRLEQLLDFIRAREPGVKGLVYVDTGPVLEKYWAWQAGIGWIGKHTNLITRDLGSWLFLGEIITTLALEPDVPETDHCGDCTLCIEACPTGAIVAPYLLDAGRCISYLTIEHRGPIPEEFGGKMDGWLYGCDVCQDVCPWNAKFAEPASVEGFSPRSGMVSPELAPIAGMTLDEFNRRFAGSPVRRAKHTGLTRNAMFLLNMNTTPDKES